MYKRLTAAIVAAAMLSSCGQAGAQTRAEPHRLDVPLTDASPLPVTVSEVCREEQMRAVWISYIDLAPIISDSEEAFRTGFEEMCRNCRDIGLNTLFVHVRAFGDAYYRSDIFPPAACLPLDARGELLYDPLEIMTETAHAEGLLLHAWINPLRLQTPGVLSSYGDRYRTSSWYGDGSGRVDEVEDSDDLWLDPSHEDVRELIAEGAAEICERYDVDGIHYDDYFYPTTDESFDAECFAADGGDDLSQYRLDCVSEMCAGIYRAVKEVDRSIDVGISPQGNIENNYCYMFADVKRWLTEDGYCDYLVPQVYYGYGNTVKPYYETLEFWRDIDRDKRLIAGLAVYKIGAEDEFTYTDGIIAEQARDALGLGCQGYALYNYISLFDGSQRMETEKEAIGALYEERAGER